MTFKTLNPISYDDTFILEGCEYFYYFYKDYHSKRNYTPLVLMQQIGQRYDMPKVF